MTETKISYLSLFLLQCFVYLEAFELAKKLNFLYIGDLLKIVGKVLVNLTVALIKGL